MRNFGEIFGELGTQCNVSLACVKVGFEVRFLLYLISCVEDVFCRRNFLFFPKLYLLVSGYLAKTLSGRCSFGRCLITMIYIFLRLPSIH